MQEDIIGITDSNYNLLCSYEYDSWGKLISIKDSNNNIITNTSHIGYINPFRYRSYYYDNETKLYYLNSRYYNPEWGRFINCDNYLTNSKELLGYNLYLYCDNEPILRIDLDGNLFGLLIGAFTVTSLVLFGTEILLEDKKQNKKGQDKGEIVKIEHNEILKNHNKNKLPTTSRPNSTKTNPNGDTRVYGPDGRALKDIDRSHPQHHPELQNPHEHDWTWENDFPRRSPARNPIPTNKVIAGATAIGAGYLIYRAIRMLPSLLPGLWWTIPVNAATP